MLHRCHFPIILYFDIKILFEDNTIAILSFKILEITWQIIPTISEYTLLYLYLHSEFQTNQRHTMTLPLKTKKPKNLTYAPRPYLY